MTGWRVGRDDGMPGEWVNDAACEGEPAEVFFPLPGRGTANAAKAICATCPVKAECLEHAVTHHEHWGVWGGMSEKERRLHRRRQLHARRIQREKEGA